MNLTRVAALSSLLMNSGVCRIRRNKPGSEIGTGASTKAGSLLRLLRQLRYIRAALIAIFPLLEPRAANYCPLDVTASFHFCPAAYVKHNAAVLQLLA
ncbi:hypothetical protein BDW75DRAFT_185677 [Aspergillus navahoensis]